MKGLAASVFGWGGHIGKQPPGAAKMLKNT